MIRVHHVGSSHVLCAVKLHKRQADSAYALQFCELTLSQCEELVATVLNAMAELA